MITYRLYFAVCVLCFVAGAWLTGDYGPLP